MKNPDLTIERNKKLNETLEDLFNSKILKVPPYQRAYAWEEKQLSQFIFDLQEMSEKGGYYYGHFILEETKCSFDVIDGQQRLTTFILFLMICKLYGAENMDKYICHFKTVNYDQDIFVSIRNNLKIQNVPWKISDFGISKEKQTLSVKKIIKALNFFKEAFGEQLKKDKIQQYITTLTQAHISTHIAYDKAVAVQIFELQNTRGISLNLIEKVKSKLMKIVYLSSDPQAQNEKINTIQEKFAEIYKLEEMVISKSFRGDLSLDEILYRHLRMIDDGTKQSSEVKNKFANPGTNNEESILKYIDDQVKMGKYRILELVEMFALSCNFISVELPKLDKNCALIGDVMILSRGLTIQFFLLLRHKFEHYENYFVDNILVLWEKLLFTWDFHNKHTGLWYKDNFEELFEKVNKSNTVIDVKTVLENYVKKGFRQEKMDNRNLQETVMNFIATNKNEIIFNAYGWRWKNKLTYVLYKYELSIHADMEQLRKIMRKEKSMEHILPNDWNWQWIGEEDSSKISTEAQNFSANTYKIINGIGNLLLIPRRENSSKGKKHPKFKHYNSCNGGSYSEHNDNKIRWKNKVYWQIIIQDRGEKIFDFMCKYFFKDQHEKLSIFNPLMFNLNVKITKLVETYGWKIERSEDILSYQNRGIIWVKHQDIDNCIIGIEDINPIFKYDDKHFDGHVFIGVYEYNGSKKYLDFKMPQKVRQTGKKAGDESSWLNYLLVNDFQTHKATTGDEKLLKYLAEDEKHRHAFTEHLFEAFKTYFEANHEEVLQAHEIFPN